MNVPDIGVAICSIGLVVFMLPTLFSSKAMVPRRTSSIPVAFFLSLMVPFFYMSGLYLTMCTVSGQAVTWWAIVKWRPIRKDFLENVCKKCGYVHLTKTSLCGKDYVEPAEFAKMHAFCEKDSDGRCIEEDHN